MDLCYVSGLSDIKGNETADQLGLELFSSALIPQDSTRILSTILAKPLTKDQCYNTSGDVELRAGPNHSYVLFDAYTKQALYRESGNKEDSI